MSIKNGDFARKKKDGYADSDIFMTRELRTLDKWDTDTINERQRELSEWVFGIWKFPDEAPPAKPLAEGVEIGAPAEQGYAELDQLPEVPA